MFKGARRLVFPDQCPLCRTLLASDAGLCGSCWRETPFIFGLACDLCGTPLMGPKDTSVVHCDTCRELARPWTRGCAALEYSGGARRMVLGLKHGDRLDLAPNLARWMASRAEPFLADTPVVVPVPIHWRRLLKRRYNQAAVLSRLLARDLDLEHLPDALVRVRHTLPMSAGAYAERHASVADAIRPHPGRRDRIAGRSVMLVDDVMTSGATLAACTTQLQNAGAEKVFVMILARATQRL